LIDILSSPDPATRFSRSAADLAVDLAARARARVWGRVRQISGKITEEGFRQVPDSRRERVRAADGQRASAIARPSGQSRSVDGWQDASHGRATAVGW